MIFTHIFGWTQGAAVAWFWMAPTPWPSPPHQSPVSTAA